MRNKIARISIIVATVLTMLIMSCAEIAYGYTNTVTESATLTVSSACLLSANSATIAFASLAPGGSDNTNYAIQFSNTGNKATNVLITAGTGTTGNWIYDANSFYVTNTLWSLSSQGSYTGTAVNTVLVDTGLSLAAPSAGGAATTNNMDFGVAVPNGEPAGAYAQTILAESSC